MIWISAPGLAVKTSRNSLIFMKRPPLSHWLFRVFVQGQTAPRLHENIEHEAANVVASFGILRRFERSAVIHLGVHIGDGDANAGPFHQGARGIGFAANQHGGEILLWILSVR